MKNRRIIYILSIFIFITINGFSNTTRTLQQLKDAEWMVHYELHLDNMASSVMNLDAMKLDEIDSISIHHYLKTELENDQTDAQMAVIYLFGESNLFKVYLNGIEIKNELEGSDFHAEIPQILENEKYTLVLKPTVAIAVSDLNSILEHAQISFLNNVFICHFKITEDTFLGGSKVEAVVKNMMEKDVDGKIIAKVYQLSNMETVAENNNCAFSRQGSEMLIEISFPEGDSIVQGQQYLVGISLVDKEQNEDVMDELLLPLKF